jgi:hypothetical protein
MLTDEAVSHDCESELDEDTAAMVIVWAEGRHFTFSYMYS